MIRLRSQRQLKEHTAVQVICPVSARAKDAPSDMAGIIDAVVGALIARPPETVLAISDYGAPVESGTGITITFPHLEARLNQVPTAVIFFRSAEHMQNWGRGDCSPLGP